MKNELGQISHLLLQPNTDSNDIFEKWSKGDCNPSITGTIGKIRGIEQRGDKAFFMVNNYGILMPCTENEDWIKEGAHVEVDFLLKSVRLITPAPDNNFVVSE